MRLRQEIMGLTLLLLMCITVVSVQAQAVASPNPAQVGQLVTITNTSSDPSHRLLNCRIEGQGSYGDIAAGTSVNFTIPQDAQPGSSYTFVCDGYVSSSSEFSSPVDPISIGVAESPPPDSDGDGIPDSQDQCPNQPAPNSNTAVPNSRRATVMATVFLIVKISVQISQHPIAMTAVPNSRRATVMATVCQIARISVLQRRD